MFGFFACGFFIVPIVLFVWAIVTIVRAITLPRNASRVPACERCGYSVADLTSFTCPECGVDLRANGIITPAIIARTRGSLTTAILAWTYIAGVVAYFALSIGVFAFSFGTGAGGWAGSFTTGWSNNLTPNSGNYRSFEITYDTDFSTITSDITLTLVDNSSALHTIVLDPNTDFVTGLASDTDWSDTTIETFFAEAGLDTTDPQIIAEAAEITSEINFAIRAPQMAMNGSNLSEHTSNAMTVASTTGTAPVTGPGLGPTAAVWLTAAVVGLLVYLLGILFIVRRRRRLLGNLHR